MQHAYMSKSLLQKFIFFGSFTAINKEKTRERKKTVRNEGSYMLMRRLCRLMNFIEIGK